VSTKANPFPFNLDDHLIDLTVTTDQALQLPAIREVVLPERMLSLSETDAKHDKFGLVVLDDNSCGFFYRLLDIDSQLINQYRDLSNSMSGRSVSDAVKDVKSNDSFQRALALGVINATTQHLHKAAGYWPPPKTARSSNPDSQHAPTLPIKIGMIGYFRQQVDDLRQLGHQVFVLELNEAFHGVEENLCVSNDITTLDDCDRIYCTASTLINNTLDELLSYFRNLNHTPQIEVVGPSAGCFPDALFSRGATLIGGSVVNDLTRAGACVRAGQPWLDAVSKFSLQMPEYPGYHKLLDRALAGAKER